MTALYCYSAITVVRGCVSLSSSGRKWWSRADPKKCFIGETTGRHFAFEKKAPNLDPLRRASDESDPPLPEVDSAVEEVEQGPVEAEEHRVDRQVAPLGVDPPICRELHLWKNLTFVSGPLNSQRVRITWQAGVIKLYRSVNYSYSYNR